MYQTQGCWVRSQESYLCAMQWSLSRFYHVLVLLLGNKWPFLFLGRLGHRESIRCHGPVHLHHPVGHLRRNLPRVEARARELALRPVRSRRLGLPSQDHVQPGQRREGGLREVSQGKGWATGSSVVMARLSAFVLWTLWGQCSNPAHSG